MKPFQRHRSGLAVQSGIEFLHIHMHAFIVNYTYILYNSYIYIGICTIGDCELQGVHTSSQYNSVLICIIKE